MDIEAELARLRSEGRLQEAATLVIETYGPGVLGFLATLLRDQVDAGEAFAQACENLWKSLPAFRGQCSMKTWFYTLARNAALNLRRAPHNRHVPLSDITDLVERVRTRTALHLRSEVKDGVAAIREELDEGDRTLLVLRVDRNMSWAEIAEVMSGGGGSEAELARAAARLRQRFHTVKERIRKRAQDIGLIGDGAERDAEP